MALMSHHTDPGLVPTPEQGSHQDDEEGKMHDDDRKTSFSPVENVVQHLQTHRVHEVKEEEAEYPGGIHASESEQTQYPFG
jgi:hypothetical protein